MIKTMTSGQPCSILSIAGLDFIKMNLPDPVGPFTRHPNGAAVSPTASIFTVSSNGQVKCQANSYILDADGDRWDEIVGGRPRNIVSR